MTIIFEIKEVEYMKIVKLVIVITGAVFEAIRIFK